ncbi:hypothetical protein N7513_011568 [Penicillium frequentans]|uniref:Large ribosomal subunit protein mL67 n=1 Tax=Penicillium frequentans TaxID=3151616 RepID=A0AAD6D045_9EURO|nr:hypothetical protein N7513_011568 [Penicillium glabrum]KAJ5546467.1 hypothetical protein N7494_004052 [Penicillium glabrum]
MASTTKPIQKILDSTRIASLSKFVRRPPIDPQTPIQGKPRNPESNAFKEYAKREGVRLQKALNAITHGKNIFVYHNVRTKQVVYSLTRYLEKNNVLNQMVYHGKKTVPAEVRRDMWVPYYSVHFSDSKLGLRAYQMLREFSMQRQLAPPKEMITVTEEFLAAKRPKGPVEAELYDRMNRKRVGNTMEKKERARALMDQKATSVADIAAVLSIQKEEIANGLLSRDGSRGYLTRKARQRRREALHQEQERAKENAARIGVLEGYLSKRSGEDVKIGEVESDYPETAETVKILWHDVHDAHYAEAWDSSIQHGKLERTRNSIIPGEARLANPDLIADNEFKEQKE